MHSTPDRACLVRVLAGDIVFLSKRLYSHRASLHPIVEIVTGEFNARGINLAMN